MVVLGYAAVSFLQCHPFLNSQKAMGLKGQKTYQTIFGLAGF